MTILNFVLRGTGCGFKLNTWKMLVCLFARFVLSLWPLFLPV